MTDERGREGQARYMRNPDVVVHEEDVHGALLYNPDDDGIRVVNRTGFHIWKLCNGNRDVRVLVREVKRTFREVPDEEVEGQVKQFLDEMLSSGFIGTVDG